MSKDPLGRQLPACSCDWFRNYELHEGEAHGAMRIREWFDSGEDDGLEDSNGALAERGFCFRVS